MDGLELFAFLGDGALSSPSSRVLLGDTPASVADKPALLGVESGSTVFALLGLFVSSPSECECFFGLLGSSESGLLDADSSMVFDLLGLFVSSIPFFDDFGSESLDFVGDFVST